MTAYDTASSLAPAVADLRAPAPPLVLTIEGLGVALRTPRGPVSVLRDVDLEVREGQTLGLVGESGCGKTVTGLSILRVLPPRMEVVSGRIVLDGQELTALTERAMTDVRGARVAMVFQDPMTSLDRAFTVGQQVAESVRRHDGVSRRSAWARAVEMLDLVGIPDAARRAHDHPHVFSGGMRQRVLIAMALACSPRLLIADEPTTALDVTTQAQILELLVGLQQRLGMAVLFITHDLGVVADVCDRVAVMYAGEVVEEAPVDELFHRPRHPYTAGLIACSPREHGHERLVAIPGSVPAPQAFPDGCRFHPRCAHAMSGRCTSEPIALRPLGDSKVRCARADDIELDGVPC